MSSDALTLRKTVPELVRVFREAVANVRSACGMLKATQKNLDDHFKLGGNTGVNVRLKRNKYTGFDASDVDVEHVVKCMERDAWRSIVDRLDIWRIMSEERAKELRTLIDEDGLPELTEENALQLAAGYMGKIGTLLDELVKEVFDWLRPRFDEYGRGYHGAQYKTNQREVVGNRVVCSWMIDRDDAKRGRFHVRYGEAQQRLHTLENLFRALDGKGSTGKGYHSDLENAINASKDGTGETEYFRFRACKNGNLHIEFTRSDLLAEFNRRAGGMNLKEAKPCK